MDDRVYPARPIGGPPKPLNGAAATAAVQPPAGPKAAPSQYRPQYRPPPPPRRSRRRSCCLCCIWTSIVILFLVLAAAVAGAIVWVIFRPVAPKFSVDSLQILALNVSVSRAVDSSISMNLTAQNPNTKMVYFYDESTVSAKSGGADLGSGSFAGFESPAGDSKTFPVAIVGNGSVVDASTATALSATLKKGTVPVTFQLDTRVMAKLGSANSWWTQIRITCDGLNVGIGKGKGLGSGSNVSCWSKIRVKIFSWQFFL